MYEQNENPWNDPQDSQSQQEMYHRNPEPGNASNGLAVAALICSVLSIVSVCCLYGAFVFGGLAIILHCFPEAPEKDIRSCTHRPAHGNCRCPDQRSHHHRKFHYCQPSVWWF